MKLVSILIPAVAVVALTIALAVRPETPAIGDDVTIKPASIPSAGEALQVAFAQEEKEEPRKTELPPGTGILKGKITLKGTPPTLPPVVAKGDPTARDAAVCAAMAVPDESLIVKDGAIANVVIYLKKAPKDYKAPPVPANEVVFDQKDCRFLPRVLTVRVGQTVRVKSGDPIAHNTHTSTFRAKEFNQAIGANDRVGVKLVYDKADNTPVKVKCDLHGWMSAYHVVTEHGLAAFTDDKGQFEIVGIPAGQHEFTVWHERPGYLADKKFFLKEDADRVKFGTTKYTISVTVEAGKTTEMNLSFDASKF